MKTKTFTLLAKEFPIDISFAEMIRRVNAEKDIYLFDEFEQPLANSLLALYLWLVQARIHREVTRCTKDIMDEMNKQSKIKADMETIQNYQRLKKDLGLALGKQDSEYFNIIN